MEGDDAGLPEREDLVDVGAPSIASGWTAGAIESGLAMLDYLAMLDHLAMPRRVILLKSRVPGSPGAARGPLRVAACRRQIRARACPAAR
ncbi:hypothetical protein mvi_23590 [Methylobacterium indicum]|uniref:Uncharacterized protein n=1 Tax=Methylobacterium indicum TaxID=1775910 RepID=A0A8H9C6I0_9HYPH|nr:hypothetical protein mvi_23590 [Methylobacterium indicum]